jgi:hypothetical protein
MIGWALGKVTGVAEFGGLGDWLLGPAGAAEAAGAWARDVSSVPQGQEERKKKKRSYKAEKPSTGAGWGCEMGGGGL